MRSIAKVLTSEEVSRRNDEILAFANQNPNVTNVALGKKYGLNRETIRLILSRGRRRAARNERLASKAREWAKATERVRLVGK